MHGIINLYCSIGNIDGEFVEFWWYTYEKMYGIDWRKHRTAKKDGCDGSGIGSLSRTRKEKCAQLRGYYRRPHIMMSLSYIYVT